MILLWGSKFCGRISFENHGFKELRTIQDRWRERIADSPYTYFAISLLFMWLQRPAIELCLCLSSNKGILNFVVGFLILLSKSFWVFQCVFQSCKLKRRYILKIYFNSVSWTRHVTKDKKIEIKDLIKHIIDL